MSKSMGKLWIGAMSKGLIVKFWSLIWCKEKIGPKCENCSTVSLYKSKNLALSENDEQIHCYWCLVDFLKLRIVIYCALSGVEVPKVRTHQRLTSTDCTPQCVWKCEKKNIKGEFRNNLSLKTVQIYEFMSNNYILYCLVILILTICFCSVSLSFQIKVKYCTCRVYSLSPVNLVINCGWGISTFCAQKVIKLCFCLSSFVKVSTHAYCVSYCIRLMQKNIFWGLYR